VLYGPKAQVQCKMLIRARFVKIGSGWKEFCDVHGLEVRDIVIVKVDGENRNQAVNVLFNIDEYYHRDWKHPSIIVSEHFYQFIVRMNYILFYYIIYMFRSVHFQLYYCHFKKLSFNSTLLHIFFHNSISLPFI